MRLLGAYLLGLLICVLLVALLGYLSSRKPSAQPPAATPLTPRSGVAWTNSLQMRFVPVVGVGPLVAVYETRAGEFDLFVTETHTPWIPPDAERDPEYAAANVTWDDAVAFCTWLTERERAAGLLSPSQRYRLPTDAEWSVAARGRAEGAENGVQPRFIWGNAWPPPANAGNFAGEEAPVDQSEPGNFIAGYKDPYPRLAPVGKFTPNTNGLFDMIGNVLEWCEDAAEDARQGRIARGGSWLNGDPDTLAIDHRATLPPRAGLNVVGFRCVLDLGN